MRIKPLLLSTSLICALTAPVWAMSHGDEGGPDHQMMWKQMDSDGDNRISKAEFTKSTEARFDKADANHDGYIDQSERDKMRENKMREKMHERMEKMREKHSKMPE